MIILFSTEKIKNFVDEYVYQPIKPLDCSFGVIEGFIKGTAIASYTCIITTVPIIVSSIIIMSYENDFSRFKELFKVMLPINKTVFISSTVGWIAGSVFKEAYIKYNAIDELPSRHDSSEHVISSNLENYSQQQFSGETLNTDDYNHL